MFSERLVGSEGSGLEVKNFCRFFFISTAKKIRPFYPFFHFSYGFCRSTQPDLCRRSQTCLVACGKDMHSCGYKKYLVVMKSINSEMSITQSYTQSSILSKLLPNSQKDTFKEAQNRHLQTREERDVIRTDSILDVMGSDPNCVLSKHTAGETKRQRSWAVMARAAIVSIARTVLTLEDMDNVRARADLLRARLQEREAAHLNVPDSIRRAAETVYKVCVTICELQWMTEGVLFPDMFACLGRVSNIRQRWRQLIEITSNQHAQAHHTPAGALPRPATKQLGTLVRNALTAVKNRDDIPVGTRAFASRLLTQATRPNPVEQQRVQAKWSEDSE